MSITTGLRVRDLRLKKGMTQDDLAERAGTTKATISKIERSTMKMSVDWMERLAKALGVSAVELIVDDAQRAPSVRQIPVVGHIAAGNWREAIEDPIGWTVAPDAGRNAFALVPTGDSMNLVIPEGAYVVVDPDDAALRDGRLYAVMNGDGETTVKMYRAEPARLVPRSSNPEHQEFLLGGAPFSIIGRVTQIVQNV